MKKTRHQEIFHDKGNGGLELYFHRCGVELRRRGFDVLTVRTEGTFLAGLTDRGHAQDIFFPPAVKWQRWVTQSSRLRKLIDEHEIDVIHAHHKDDLPLLALVRSRSGRKFRAFFTRQMPLPHSKRDLYHRWLYGKLDGMIAITEKLRREIVERIPIAPERVQRLYYGVPAAPVRDEDWIRNFLSVSEPGDFNLGVFSRFEFQKGQHTVVESLRILRERGCPAKLYLGGNVADPKYFESLQKTIREHGLEHAVAFKGFMKEPMRAMQAVDVYILPSRAEAFGLVLAEAMRCGTAVIGTNAGGVPEIIEHGETGFLYEWDDAAGLAGLLTNLFHDVELRTTVARRGRVSADERFDERKHFDHLAELIS